MNDQLDRALTDGLRRDAARMSGRGPGFGDVRRRARHLEIGLARRCGRRNFMKFVEIQEKRLFHVKLFPNPARSEPEGARPVSGILDSVCRGRRWEAGGGVTGWRNSVSTTASPIGKVSAPGFFDFLPHPCLNPKNQ